mgnify:CR=1 FL=1
MAELTGMAPTKIEAAEISQAFSTGAVESMITSPTTGKNSKIWENGVKYFYDIAAWFPKNMIVAHRGSRTSVSYNHIFWKPSCNIIKILYSIFPNFTVLTSSW